MLEARNLRNMTVQQTPLLGEENTPLHSTSGNGTGFEGATPRHQVAFTPNPLATPLHNGPDGLGVGATPRGDAGSVAGATPLRTPLRDSLSINPSDGTALVGNTPREQRMRVSSAKRTLQQGFLSLPKPENNFELLVPDDEEDDAIDGSGAERDEDAEERDARIKRAQEEERLKALARRSLAVRHELPRPPNVDLDALMQALNLGVDDSDELSSARRLVNSELVALVKHDSIVHPVPGTSTPGGTPSLYQMPDDDAVKAAKDLVHLELAGATGFPDATEEQVRQTIIATVDWSEADNVVSWAKTRPALVLNAKTGVWVPFDTLSTEERVAGYNAVLSESRDMMGREATKAAKIEKKLAVTLGGYQARSSALTNKITDAFTQMHAAKFDLESFSRLQINESVAGPARVAALREEVASLERKESNLQERYAELDGERRDALSRVAAMEDRIMAEAEALNEAVLAESEG
jgi:pre-mRNA-splicing factor CDC5/CEF1